MLGRFWVNCNSDAWFSGFKKRYHLSMRRATNTCQKEPADKCSSIQHFHCSIRRTAQEGDQVGPLGQWTPRSIANMDQTPLPFTFSDGPTYADTGERSVWVHGGACGLKIVSAQPSLPFLPVADLGFHEGGFIRSGVLVCPLKFCKPRPLPAKKPRPLRS